MDLKVRWDEAFPARIFVHELAAVSFALGEPKETAAGKKTHPSSHLFGECVDVG
jgi:hypothetical protein